MSNQFERLNSHKNYWHNKAADLFRGACKINENDSDGFLDSVTKMLMGMSFEALFKGLTVAKGLEYKKTHDLLKLANDACVEVSDEEQKILSILTQYIIWDGRYPTPKEPNALEMHWLERHQFENNIKNVGTLKIATPNQKLNFQVLTEMWRKYSATYWK